MSTEVGLYTQYLNWRTVLMERGLAEALNLCAEWITVNWRREGGMIERMSFLPGGVRGRLRAAMELREGFRKAPFDFLYVAAVPAFYFQPGYLQGQTYFITADCTERQQYGFGDLYGKRPSRFVWIERGKHCRRTELYQGAVAYFPWSRWAAEGMINDHGIDPSRVHIMPPGVLIDRWCIDRSTPRPCETVRILFVGGDFYRKGGDLLLRWAERTGRKNWRLDLVTRDSVNCSLSNVHVHNGLSSNDPQLVQLYREADLFALPTRGDCYSIASIEAMAAGLPVVLSEVGGTGDILREGETGFLIPPGDGDALADRLDWLLERPEQARKMGLAARQDAQERYDMSLTVAQTLETVRRYLR